MRVSVLFPLLFLAFLALTGPPLLTGCGSIPQEDAKAQAETFNAIWPRHEAYLAADAALTAEDKDTYKQTGVTWRDKITSLLKLAKVPFKFENGRFTLNEAPRGREWQHPERQPKLTQMHSGLLGNWRSEPSKLAPFDRLAVRHEAPGFGPGCG